ncbi:hypothetical protein, partial [Smaragdicoccus niigatensis]
DPTINARRESRIAQTLLAAAAITIAAPAFASAAPTKNYCTSVNGRTSSKGTAQCSSIPGGNWATARGDGARAYAGDGRGNRATANGDGSEAIAGG